MAAQIMSMRAVQMNRETRHAARGRLLERAHGSRTIEHW